MLETGIHKEFVSKVILDLFIDNFGYELGEIHGSPYDVEKVREIQNTKVLNSFFDKIDRQDQITPFHKIKSLKSCYEKIASEACRIGTEQGREHYFLFKDSIYRR
ncbi:hypothetical protein [Pseudalkalibacillus caeni]|uniref:Uncharacterized protein n=1 Tax=Exobacillus caeni TaxID=2574798 RepID=A0A5R9FGC3_9BACL|nr:hypothetical protein [Pseudalkalibacillus caeni]TLS38585.1 hypothetical protein FCL54_03540 [Pseudalkalibacillus caeni]